MSPVRLEPLVFSSLETTLPIPVVTARNSLNCVRSSVINNDRLLNGYQIIVYEIGQWMPICGREVPT